MNKIFYKSTIDKIFVPILKLRSRLLKTLIMFRKEINTCLMRAFLATSEFKAFFKGSNERHCSRDLLLEYFKGPAIFFWVPCSNISPATTDPAKEAAVSKKNE